MKKIIAMVLCLVLVFSLAGCGTKEAENYSPVAGGANMPNNSEVIDTEKTQETDIVLVNIVDLTEVNQLSTDSALEEFFKDADYTYYFPSIKSEYIECQFSNGDTVKFVEALESKKVAISDLDAYGIQYWLVDKNGNYINSLDKETNETEPQEMCDGVPLAPEGFSKP